MGAGATRAEVGREMFTEAPDASAACMSLKQDCHVQLIHQGVLEVHGSQPGAGLALNTTCSFPELSDVCYDGEVRNAHF